MLVGEINKAIIRSIQDVYIHALFKDNFIGHRITETKTNKEIPCPLGTGVTSGLFKHCLGGTSFSGGLKFLPRGKINSRDY